MEFCATLASSAPTPNLGSELSSESFCQLTASSGIANIAMADSIGGVIVIQRQQHEVPDQAGAFETQRHQTCLPPIFIRTLNAYLKSRSSSLPRVRPEWTSSWKVAAGAGADRTRSVSSRYPEARENCVAAKPLSSFPFRFAPNWL